MHQAWEFFAALDWVMGCQKGYSVRFESLRCERPELGIAASKAKSRSGSYANLGFAR